MTDWVTISSLATAGGTLVLAVATFSSVQIGQPLGAGRRAVAAARYATGADPVAQRRIRLSALRFGDGTFLNIAGHGSRSTSCTATTRVAS